MSRQAIGKHVSAGTIPIDAAGKIDVDLARKALADRVRPSSKTAMALETSVTIEPEPKTALAEKVDAEVTSYHVAKTLREVAEARMAQLKLAEQRGSLISVDAIRSALSGVISSTRDSLLQLPARLAPVLAAETDAAKVHDLIQAELHQALAQLTSSPERITTLVADA